jgi:hypothetical protein
MGALVGGMLTVDQLLDDACAPDPAKVAAALQAARGRGAELTPGLVARLEEAVVHSDQWDGGKDGRSPGFLLFLAAEFRETRAHEPITRLLRLPDDLPYSMFSDTVTEDGATILADTYGDDPGPLRALVEDAAAGPFERGAGLQAVAVLVARGRWQRTAVLDWLQALAAPLRVERENDGLFANAIVDTALLLGAWELRGFVLGLYDRGLADSSYVEPEYVEETLIPGTQMDPAEDRLARTITDAWEAVNWWAFFDPLHLKNRRTTRRPASPLKPSPEPQPAVDEGYLGEAPKPYVAPNKPGRNDPCPCGSGKKYKKCCGA